MSDEVFVARDTAGILTVLGNEHYLDGRTFEIHKNDCEHSIVLVGTPDYEETLARFPSHDDAVVVYNLACGASTLDEVRTVIKREVNNE